MNDSSNNILNINTKFINIVKSGKIFYNIFYNTKLIEIDIKNGFIPFGTEKFNNKMILNIELLNSNETNNIISKIESIENEITNNFKNIGLIKCSKKSKLGYLLRTHITKTTESYILKKDNSKFDIDIINTKNSECDLKLKIKGIWANNNNYGLYITIDDININKFN